MKRKFQIAVFALIASATIAQAATGGPIAGLSPLMVLLIGFSAMIIVFQLIPGMILLASMLKGIFSFGRNPVTPRTIGKKL
jgi:hypothetical protein